MTLAAFDTSSLSTALGVTVTSVEPPLLGGAALNGSSGGLSTGAIAGIVLGAVAGLLLLAGGAFAVVKTNSAGANPEVKMTKTTSADVKAAGGDSSV